MSYVTILWSIAGSTALVLGVVHGLVWALDRRAWANLAFAIVAVSVMGMVSAELGMMYARSPEQWSEWVRRCHVPIFFATIGMVLFVRLYLGTGRWWLAWTIVAFRCVILWKNFAAETNFNFSQVLSLDSIRFMGEDIAVIGNAVTSSWQWIATAGGVLFAIFVVDATVARWRKGDRVSRRKALVTGGGTALFVVLAIAHTQLMIWGIARLPVMIALPFLITLIAVAFELSRDIFEAPRLARDLAESERRLELAASAAGLGLWVWDIVANRFWATQRARALLGFRDDDVLSPDRWMERVQPEDAGLVRHALHEALASGCEYAVEYRLSLPNGTTRWIAAMGRSEPDAWGRPALMRGVIRDVTARKTVQNESDELRRDLAHAGRVTMLGQLASSLAHELSQPLAAILRNAEAAEMMLRRSAPDLEELRAIVADIHRDDRRAADVIVRLRALLKRRHLDFQPIGVEGLVQDVKSLVHQDAASKCVTLECVVAQGLPNVSGDRVHLSQVLINLIINGIDAVAEARRPRGSVTVAARSVPEGAIEVAVTDSGTGISPEALARLFEPFFTTKVGGMGMGLVVSRTIVEAHGGRLWAENNETGGATFRFTIPAKGDRG